MCVWREFAATLLHLNTSALRGGLCFLCCKFICIVFLDSALCGTDFCLFLTRRIVCDMEESLMSSPPGGPVELCIGDCSADYRTQSSQMYSFVVRPLLLCLGKGQHYFKTSRLCLKLEECCFIRQDMEKGRHQNRS